MSKTGRKASAEWLEVDYNEGKHFCKHCKKEISSKIERIRSHLKKCTHRKISVGNDVDSDLDCGSTSCSAPKACKITEETGSANRNLDGKYQDKKLQQKSMKDFVLPTTPEQKNKFDIAIAKFFFANNIPFNAAESHQFKSMIELIRPGYTPPTANIIGGRLLDTVTAEVDENMKLELESPAITITLFQDGWSNIKNDSIIANTMYTGKNNYIVNISEGGTEKKTAQRCFRNIVASIEMIKEKYACDVFAVVTDNENKMKKMRSLINEKYPKMVVLGCSAHLMNLVEKEVTPNTIMKYVVEVQKYFRNVHLAHGWLKAKGGLMPQIPNETRWNSHADALSTFVANYHKYKEIHAENSQQFTLNIAKILENINIYHQAIELKKQLDIISKALDRLQMDNCFLSESVEVWIDILQNEELKNYRQYFEKRFEQAITPLHFLANLTDPRFKGRKLSREYETIVHEYIEKEYPSFLPAILGFVCEEEDYFPMYLFSKSVTDNFSPSAWWRMAGKKGKVDKIPEGLCEFLAHLHSVPASSGAIERVFSTFGLVWGKLRNRLGTLKAEKLVKVYRGLNLKHV